MAAFQRLLSMSVKSKKIVRASYVLQTPTNYFSVQSSMKSAYGADGKTFVSILNNEQDAPLMIDGYSKMGFRLNNGLFVVGPVALFPHSILSWNVEGDDDITEASLSLFLNLYPKLDLLIIGLSDPRNEKALRETRLNVYKMMGNLKEKINIEVMPTEKAVTIFNYVNCENRFVGAALIPPTHYSPNLDDLYRTKYLQQKNEDKDYLPI